MKETLLPAGTTAQNQAIAEVVREFLPYSRKNEDARIYLTGYYTETVHLDPKNNLGPVGRMLQDLQTVRGAFVTSGVRPNRVVIIAVLLGDKLKAERISALITPVRLPVEVWDGAGYQTGAGQSPPWLNVEPSIEDDYDKKSGEFSKKIQVEVEVKLKTAFKPLKSLKSTMKHDGAAFEEANAEITLKQAILDALMWHQLKDLTLAVKASGTVADDDETPERKLTKIKGKIKGLLSVQVRAINGTISGFFFVDSKGGVGGGVEIKIPWD
ncbi:MAG: hypothetical protein JNK87_32980 [Bryobacterales bacterium]|nr:hypothetical protein [Bryobacterales bacterium]